MSQNEKLKEANFKVLIRVYKNESEILKSDPTKENKILLSNKERGFRKCYEFDKIYWNETNQFLYDDLKNELIKSTLKDQLNTTIFFYGQTNSGKTYTAFGNDSDEGLVYRYASSVLEYINDNQDSNIFYELKFSMIEIYLEKYRDLLKVKNNDKKKKKLSEENWKRNTRPKTSNKLLEKKKLNIDIETSYNLVNNIDEIRDLINLGKKNRIVASTFNRSHISSRSHAIIGFHIIEKNTLTNKNTKVETMFVDLAGTERIIDRENKYNFGEINQMNRIKIENEKKELEKQTSFINKSLFHLNVCFENLSKKRTIDYGSSLLTKILRNSLGGNAMSYLIGTLNSDKKFFQYSKNTLEYAYKATSIRVRVEKVLVEQSEEMKRLYNDLKQAQLEVKRIKLQFLDSQKKFEEEKKKIEKHYEEKFKLLKQGYNDTINKIQIFKKTDTRPMTEKMSHFRDIHSDYSLNGTIPLIIPNEIEEKHQVIGSDKEKVDIYFQGIGIKPQHAILEKGKDNTYYIKKFNKNCMIKVNGVLLKDNEKKNIDLFDHVCLGTSNYYAFIDIKDLNTKYRNKTEINQVLQSITIEKFETKIIEAAVENLNDDKIDKKEKIEYLKDNEMAKIINAIDESNQISIDLDQKMKYELFLSKNDLGVILMGINAKKFGTSMNWKWPINEFEARKIQMDKIYDFHKLNDKNDDNDDSDSENESENNVFNLNPFCGNIKNFFLGKINFENLLIEPMSEIFEKIIYDNFETEIGTAIVSLKNVNDKIECRCKSDDLTLKNSFIKVNNCEYSMESIDEKFINIKSNEKYIFYIILTFSPDIKSYSFEILFRGDYIGEDNSNKKCTEEWFNCQKSSSKDENMDYYLEITDIEENENILRPYRKEIREKANYLDFESFKELIDGLLNNMKQ